VFLERPADAVEHGGMRRLSVLTAALVVLALAAPQARADDVLNPGTRLWVNPSSTTVQAAKTLTGQDRANALALAKVPTATWLTQGTPAQTRSQAFQLGLHAALQGAVPVITAYNIPGRDCSQYSAGGAANTKDYKAWINGLAQGLALFRSVVVLEPDGIALAPADCGGTAEQQTMRVRQMNYAVDRLQSLHRTGVYIDAGHSAWHNVEDIAARLVANGIDEADGFFLNVSNYRTNAELIRYGTMVSECVSYIVDLNGAAKDCPNQYSPPADADAWYAAHVTTPTSRLPHFIIDTSRNGRGPWTPPANTYSDPQDWCNPPGRGLGDRPTTRNTGSPLLDAKLWVKVPGESDGSCTRGLPAGSADPEWGMVDPPAGAWFKEQAAQLIQLAVPPLR
jgi:endoglucanase